jgi:hypothetical protein
MPDHSNLPLPRGEWLLTRSKVLEGIIDYVVQKPRVRWHVWRWKRQRTPLALSNYESRVYSEWGEDGILAEIFRRIGEGSKYAVEFGIQDGTECCTRNLIVHHGWRGLLIEGSTDYVIKARSVYTSLPSVSVVGEFITAENILKLFQDHHVPRAPDLLVIDIDGNDYWVWERILSSYRPRVVVIEYNARWVPPTEWVMDYNPKHSWNGTVYFGASLTSLAKLGSAHGYSLVGCNSLGNNAFFVRNDLLGEHFPDQNKGVAYHYAPPLYGRGYGHSIHERLPEVL